MGRFIDLAGRTIGRWTVLRRLPNGRNRSTLWLCRCECGTEKEVFSSHLVRGLSQSCGCLRHDTRPRLTHGHTKAGNVHSPEYSSWRHMMERCRNPRHKHYDSYGGRGIGVARKWLTFAGFIDDMGLMPAGGYSIERKDPNLGYNKANCVWLPRRQQARNRRNTVRVNFKGRTASLIDLCEELGVPYSRAYNRLTKLGWPPERALSSRG